MLMSSHAPLERFFGSVEVYPEIAGKRVLILGITSAHGIDIARAFAEHRARLILQIDEPSAETDALGEVLAPVATDLQIFNDPLKTGEDVVAFSRRAMAAFGGIDVAIVLVPLSLGCSDGSIAAVEARLSEVLLTPCLVSRVATNRMKMLGIAGVVLHVARLPRNASAEDLAFASAAKATLATMVRSEARAVAADGIRINAVAPETAGASGHGLAGEADVAALALFLATGRGSTLSGQVFEADVRA